MNQSPAISSLIWSVADLLRGDYKPSEYGKVILPFTVLRRLDCVLGPTKAAVLAEKAKREAVGVNPGAYQESCVRGQSEARFGLGETHDNPQRTD